MDNLEYKHKESKKDHNHIIFLVSVLLGIFTLSSKAIFRRLAIYLDFYSYVRNYCWNIASIFITSYNQIVQTESFPIKSIYALYNRCFILVCRRSDLGNI